MDTIQAWDAVLSRLSEKISQMEFYTWFKKIRLSEISGAAVVLSCPTEMNKNWVENKYHGLILVNIQAILPEIERVFFKVDLSLADAPPSNPSVFQSPSKKPRKLPNRPEVKIDEGLHSLVIHQKFTLQNFVVGEENRLAHAACHAVAESDLKGVKKYNPLFVYGGVGLGKTHLLQGTANEILRRHPGAKVVYTTAERFTNEIVQSIRDRTIDGLRKKYRRVDALVIDDVQFFEGKERTQEELFNTFNDLYDFNKQIMFSSDRPPSELGGLSDRLRSRMGWGLSVDVQLPNYETRLAILQEKSMELNIVLPRDVQDFIAANIRKSLRELENLLNQIVAELELSRIPPTPQSVGRILRKLNPMEDLISADSVQTGLAKSPDDIITIISEYFQIPATELIGTSRKKEIVFPRQICWLLCKEILRMSFEAIGYAFGGKNHTTIMHGIKKIQDLRRKDSTTARHIHALKKDLGVK